MESKERSVGVSRRAVLMGAVAVGGALAVSNAFGTESVVPQVRGDAAASSAATQAKQTTRSSANHVTAAAQTTVATPMFAGWSVQPFELSDVEITGGVFDRAKQGCWNSPAIIR